MKHYFEVIKKYAVFSGRASQSEYWMFFLINTLVALVLTFIDVTFFFSQGASNAGELGPLNTIYTLIVFMPGLAVFIRRLHDTGKSGWYALLLFIPLIGAILIIVRLATSSDKGANKFGPDPKDVTA